MSINLFLRDIKPDDVEETFGPEGVDEGLGLGRFLSRVRKEREVDGWDWY